MKHVKEAIFTEEGGLRRGVPKVLVVLTDGRSQDDVNKVSKEMQLEGVLRMPAFSYRCYSIVILSYLELRNYEITKTVNKSFLI